ncbi:hypothetical protein BDF19DRAFT_436361 [Syncephalis fuscata]|nr:hypothetical protein BDF19DRAFT_436361 [Syncephalis fuscata]
MRSIIALTIVGLLAYSASGSDEYNNQLACPMIPSSCYSCPPNTKCTYIPGTATSCPTRKCMPTTCRICPDIFLPCPYCPFGQRCVRTPSTCESCATVTCKAYY